MAVCIDVFGVLIDGCGVLDGWGHSAGLIGAHHKLFSLVKIGHILRTIAATPRGGLNFYPPQLVPAPVQASLAALSRSRCGWVGWETKFLELAKPVIFLHGASTPFFLVAVLRDVHFTCHLRDFNMHADLWSRISE